MNKEIIEKRLADLNKHIDQCIANYNMLLGGREECTFWLKQLNETTSSGMELHEVKKLLGADSVEIEKVG